MMFIIDCDTENGGMQLNNDFCVDFGEEPDGPSLAHEVTNIEQERFLLHAKNSSSGLADEERENCHLDLGALPWRGLHQRHLRGRHGQDCKDVGVSMPLPARIERTQP